MILDTIENAGCYAGLHPDVDRVLEAVRTVTAEAYPTEKRELDGRNAFLLFPNYETHRVENAQFEAHRAYIDVMYMVEGEELIYVKPTAALNRITKPYEEASDALLGAMEEDCTPVLLKAGMFVILFPQDAHAPACCVHDPKPVKKIIGKVRISQQA